MQFLADVFVTCPICEGRRFQNHILQIRYRGKNVHDVLEMTVIVGFGPRIRALAVRLERSVPDNTAPPGTAAGRPARWLCTAVEAA